MAQVWLSSKHLKLYGLDYLAKHPYIIGLYWIHMWLIYCYIMLHLPDTWLIHGYTPIMYIDGTLQFYKCQIRVDKGRGSSCVNQPLGPIILTQAQMEMVMSDSSCRKNHLRTRDLFSIFLFHLVPMSWGFEDSHHHVMFVFSTLEYSRSVKYGVFWRVPSIFGLQNGQESGRYEPQEARWSGLNLRWKSSSTWRHM